MTSPTVTSFEERLRAWLLSCPVARVARETGLSRRTLYRWLNGECQPRGMVRMVVAARVDAWEALGAEAARLTPSRACRSVRGGARRA